MTLSCPHVVRRQPRLPWGGGGGGGEDAAAIVRTWTAEKPSGAALYPYAIADAQSAVVSLMAPSASSSSSWAPVYAGALAAGCAHLEGRFVVMPVTVLR